MGVTAECGATELSLHIVMVFAGDHCFAVWVLHCSRHSLSGQELYLSGQYPRGAQHHVSLGPHLQYWFLLASCHAIPCWSALTCPPPPSSSPGLVSHANP